MLGTLLIGSAGALYWTNFERVQEINLFALVLVVQSLPFLAAALLAALEMSQVNDYATWRRLDARLAALRPRRAPAADAGANHHDQPGAMAQMAEQQRSPAPERPAP